MLDNLLDIEVAYSLLKDEKKGDPIDANYEKLKTDMEVGLLHGTWWAPGRPWLPPSGAGTGRGGVQDACGVCEQHARSHPLLLLS